MRLRQPLSRSLFFIFLLACLLTGLIGVVDNSVSAAPQMQIATDVVISEFRTRGPSGGNDEFIELYNPTTLTIDISGWKINGSNNTGSTSTRATIPPLTFLHSGQYYLVVNNGYSGSVLENLTYGAGITDTGGIALLRADNTIADQVGMNTNPSSYKEGAVLPSLSGTTDQSYQRKVGGLSDSCQDFDDNFTDFTNITPSDPQNLSSPLSLCGTILPTLTPTNTPGGTDTATPTATPALPLSVLINEVAWAGNSSANANDEWIELYNPGLIDLNGWRIVADDGNPDITLNGITTNDVYFVVGRYGSIFSSGATVDLAFTSSMGVWSSLDNNGEVLRLLDPNGYQVDSANIDGGGWPAGLGSPIYASMERLGSLPDDIYAWATYEGTVPIAFDRTTTPNPIKGTPGQANWISTVTVTPSPTPTATRTSTLTRTPTKTRTPTPVRTSTRTPTPQPPPPPPPLIAINEFVPRPGHDWNNDGVVNTGDEYIELLNHGVIDVNLSGYKLDDEANVGSPLFSLPSVTLKPGERIVFYGSETGLLLGDGGDGVRLLKSNGQLVDAYNYSVVEFPDQSYCRLPDNGGADDWNTNCYPTPGLQNSLSGTVLRPPTQNDEDNPLCPIADTLPQEFVLAECSPFGNNIWSRYYWDKFGWYGEKSLLNVNSKWDVYAD
jgi:hypothetical protein